MRRPLIIANWKMNPASAREAVSLAGKIERGLAGFRGADAVIAPPFPFLLRVSGVLKKSFLGAQDCFWEKTGPYTGEVGAEQLKSAGVRFVIVGHSERRINLGETDEMINKKTVLLLNEGFSAVLCVGERERRGNDIPDEVGEQLKKNLAGANRRALQNLIVAYEPVWAISTTPNARADTPDGAFRAALFIKKILSGLFGGSAAETVRVIYGGSVKSSNAAAFFREAKMDGALVGGASLDAGEFLSIVKSSLSAASGGRK